MIKRIQHLLDQYSGHTIEAFAISTEKNEIQLQLDHMGSKVNVRFDEVKTYLYLDETLQETDISSAYPASPISYYQNGYGEFVAVEVDAEGEMRENRVALPNFLLSMMDGSVLIEAHSIEVDGVRYGTKDYRH